ncbi:protein phosphatase 1 regulatory subunit 35 [Epinephelus moara]|uniref:protein phosphatase 1 regulatory subunit 35 n=1 Tax=Epinephelus moara TaxID=300413 RepID=UPI00214EAD99|nr:protein phosphatase 1 regulatory subunit 35 [Epinephelus moara]
MNSASVLSSPHPPPPAPLPLTSYSPSLTGCPELDLSVTLSPAPKTSHTHLKLRPLKTSQQTDQSQLKLGLQGQNGRKRNIQVCSEDRMVVRVTSEKSRDAPPQQAIRGQRRNRGCHHAPTQQAEPPAAVSNQDPSCLERAELNTTLALKAELQSLQGAEFNSQKAVLETLLKSERTKNLINTRATEEVNVSRSQLLFSSLVCVDVQEDQLISQMLQHRLLLPPPLPGHGAKAADGPSLQFFMTSDHLRQKPVPPEEELVNHKPCPSPRPAYSTFDLYRRGRC